MDLEHTLNLVVGSITPPNVSSYVSKGITDELLRLLHSPTRTIPQVESLLYNIKTELNVPSQYKSIWKLFEDIIYPLFSMHETADMVNHLNRSYLRLQESIGTLSWDDNRVHSFTLNKENLDSYNNLDDQYIAPSIYAESFETLDKFSDRRSMLSSLHNYATNDPTNNVALKDLAGPYYIKTISEEEIMKHISYTLLGTTSDIFPIENDSIKVPYTIPNALSGRLHLLFEGGLIYKSLTQKIDFYKHVTISPLKQALIVETERYLNSYSGLINEVILSRKTTTLNDLYLRLNDSIINLRLYYYFMDKFQRLRGDELLSLFNFNMTNGDKSIQAVSSALNHNLISLYFEYLVDWLLLGKLEDIYGEEFFIRKDPKYQQYNFAIPFTFEENKVPSFLPKNTAYEVYLIGKTYNFITIFCKELQWADDFSKKYSFKYENLRQLPSDFPHRLIEIVHEQYLEIVKFSNDTLKTKCHYVDIINMLKNILLMGRGDVIDILFIKSQHLLNQPIKTLKNYVFTRILQESIQQSSFRNYLKKKDNNFLVNKLDARLLNMGNDLLGWDVFTLDYILHPPLSTVLNVNRSDGKKEYLQIFNFLWRFKRSDFFSNEEMLRTKQLIRSFKKNTRFSPFSTDITNKLSKLSILRSRIQQFNYKMENYYTQFIIEKNFIDLNYKLKLTKNESELSGKINTVNFSNDHIRLEGILKPENDLSIFGVSKEISVLDEIPNIEELDSLHNQFLEELLSHKLLSSNTVGKHSKQPYSRSLIFIFEEILEFIQSYSQLSDIAYHIFLQINLQNDNEVDSFIEKFNAKSQEVVSSFKAFEKATYTYIMDIRDDGDDELRQLSRLLR